MAIYRLKADIISRSRGQSIIASAAYRSAQKLQDEYYGEVHDYTHKQDVVHTEILLPVGAPPWMSDRQKLWNEVEAREKRKDSQLAREIQIALPRELTLSQNIQLTREFIEKRFVSIGMVADVAIHIPKAKDGELQPHAHVLLTMREIKENRFGRKAREWNERCELKMWRTEWCDFQNRYLALYGHDMRVDHRSLKERGIDLIPQKKMGPTGSYHCKTAREQHYKNARTNGEYLLTHPEVILEILTYHQSTFTYQDMARIVNRYTADSEQFSRVYEKVKNLPSLLTLGRDSKNQERFTTKNLFALENKIIDLVDALSHRLPIAVQQGQLEGRLEYYENKQNKKFTDEQKRAIKHLLKPSMVTCLVGRAGTGKSFSLGFLRELWEGQGVQVHGVALSGIAASQLKKEAGYQAHTIATFLLRAKSNPALVKKNDVIVMDEAGMRDSYAMFEIFNVGS